MSKLYCVKISHCNDCPYVRFGVDASYCHNPDSANKSLHLGNSFIDIIIPGWCPLHEAGNGLV
jgi:hypothetical protein